VPKAGKRAVKKEFFYLPFPRISSIVLGHLMERMGRIGASGPA
jgi:hypothetical protein